MQFFLPIVPFFTKNVPPPYIRVVSYNIGGMGAEYYPALQQLLEQNTVDVAALQECSIEKIDSTGSNKHWHFANDLRLCLFSRFPIFKKEVRDPQDIWKLSGSGMMARYGLTTPDGPIYLVNLHLETPREGIEAVIENGRQIASALFHIRLNQAFDLLSKEWWNPPAMQEKTFIRQLESKIAREWVDQTPRPVMVTGDFNMPVNSGIYRQFWSKFQNAYSEGGNGLENTKQTRWFGIRIDHILAGPEWKIQKTWVGPRIRTDHAPLFSDLHLGSGNK
jgi:exonuclease III